MATTGSSICRNLLSSSRSKSFICIRNASFKRSTQGDQGFLATRPDRLAKGPGEDLCRALDGLGLNVLLRLEAPGGADCQDCATIHLVRKLDQPQPRRTGS